MAVQDIGFVASRDKGQRRPSFKNGSINESPSVNARAALDLAARGFRVFPVTPLGKTPLTENGFKDATDKPAAVAGLWALHPQANIGVAMGEFVVLDIDGADGLGSFGRITGHKDPLRLSPLAARTASGGYHVWFKRCGMHVRNRAGDIGPGLDVRGVTRDGEPAGYVLVAPSKAEKKDGSGVGSYEWLDPSALERLDQVPEMPRELAYLCTFNKREREAVEGDTDLKAKIEAASPQEWLSVFDAHRPQQTSAAGELGQVPYQHPYIQAILQRECEEIAATPPGCQETTFNDACFRIGARLKSYGLGAHASDAIGRLVEAGQSMVNERGREAWKLSELREKARHGVLDGLERGTFPPKDLGTTTVDPAIDAEIARLAALHPVIYDQQRKGVGKKLGVRTDTLDVLVTERRKNLEPKKGGDIFADDEPWPEPVDGLKLLKDIVAVFKRYAILPQVAAEIVALWVLHAHALDAATHSPILVLSSPEKRCGKTTVAKIVAALAPKGQHTANITPAVLFRVIEAHRPTLVIDEADTFFDLNDELRGIINGGHDRETAYVWRVEGEGAERHPEPFSVWAPKVIALIGTLPDTIEDRSIKVPLRRKLPSEKTDRLPPELRKAFADLRRRAARWATDNLEALKTADPQLPNELNDRAGDNWRPLLAIADLLGGPCPRGARHAAVTLSTATDDDDSRTALLRDIRELFLQNMNKDLPVHRAVEGLNGMQMAPWGEFREGKGISARELRKRLKPFEIKSHETKNNNAYRFRDFADAFNRYLDGGLFLGEAMVDEAADER